MRRVRVGSNASWVRKIVIGSCIALGLGVLSFGTAGATMTPAMGSLSCALGGTASLNPVVPMSGQPSTVGWTMEKIHQAPISSCNASGVTGGKSVITGGVLQVNARLDKGASCATLVTSLSSVSHIVVMLKLTNTVTTTTVDPVTGLPVTTTMTSTSASVRVTNVIATPSGGGVLLTGTAQQSASGNKPFSGEIVAVQLNGTGDCTTAPLTFLDLTGSTVSIHQ
jgi:hypothetical protein